MNWQMKILITGIGGFVGRNLSDRLISDHEVWGLVRQKSDISKLHKNIQLFYFNNDMEKLISFFQEEQFDGVIHLASLFLSSHKPRDIKNLISSNLTLGTLLLEASVQSKVKWFLNTGTFWQHYKNETYNPVNLYAAIKEAFEVLAVYYMQTSNLVFTTIKLNDTFGKDDTRDKIFALWAKIAKSKESLSMSKGEQLMDIVYIEDVVEGYKKMIEHLSSKDANLFHNKTFALKAKKRVSLKELAKIYEECLQVKLNIKWGERKYRQREVMMPWEDGEIIPGWSPKYSIKDAILNMHERE